MPRTLFDRTFAPQTTNPKSFGTIAISILLHAAALAGFAVWQLTAPETGPDVVARLHAYVVPPQPKLIEPPSPQPPSQAHTAAVDTRAPATAPDVFTVEPEVAATATPGAGVLGVPTGTDLGVSTDGLAALPGAATVVLTGPPPARKDPIRVGGQVRAPDRIAYVAPTYPTIAQTARVEGEVVLEATIDASGAVTHVIVRKSVPFLDRAAIDAVSKWRYRPTLLNGEAVPVIMLVTVRFTLR